jgi:conjugal transfer mating pair stabilization protein TraN
MSGRKTGDHTYNCTTPHDRYTFKGNVCACSGTGSYTCPSGGTLSETTCNTSSSYNATLTYTCNTGDTLNSTTHICTSVVSP